MLIRRGVVGALALLTGCGIQAPDSPPQTSADSSSPTAAVSPSSGTKTRTDQATLNQALRDAAWRSDEVTAADLIREGADVNATDNASESAYLIAASESDLPFMHLMLDEGADVSATDSWNGTGLIRAAERGNYLVVGALVQAGVDISHINAIGYQAIHEAVWLGQDSDDYVDTVRVLAAAGADLSTKSQFEGLTPSEMALDRGFTRLTQTLRIQLEGAPAKDPAAALHTAVRKDDADAVARALRDGADLNALGEGGKSPLRLALENDRGATLRLLIALGADAGQPDADGVTPLMVAATSGDADFVTLVATSPELDLDLPDTLGQTALMRAAVGGDGSDRYQRIARILLAAGANPNMTNADGLTAAELAEAAGHSTLVTILAPQ